MSRPLVSIVIPTYNSAAYLPEMLESIFVQAYEPLEVIVVDDGSTDETQRVLDFYADRIRYQQQENFGGPSQPRNVGIRLASADYIAFFDSDDIMMPGALDSAMRVFADHPAVDVVFANCQSIDEQHNVIRADYLAIYQNFRKILQPTADEQVGLLAGPELYHELIRANFVGTCSVVVRRQALQEVGPFDESLKNGDDRDMWLRLAYAGKQFAFIDRVHFAYRKRDGSVTRRHWQRVPSVLRVLHKHRQLITTDADRDFLDRRIGRIELGYAFGLREDGQLRAAAVAYRSALRRRLSLRGLSGLLMTWLRLATGGEGKERRR